MGWGEPHVHRCSCEGCDRDTLASLRLELARARAEVVRHQSGQCGSWEMAYAWGRDEERAAVVAWLRERAMDDRSSMVANRIKRGEHRSD